MTAVPIEPKLDGDGDAFLVTNSVPDVVTDRDLPFDGCGCISSSSFQSKIDAAFADCLPSADKTVDEDSELLLLSDGFSIGGLPLPRPLPRPLAPVVGPAPELLVALLSTDVATGDFISTSEASDSLCR